MALTIGKLAKRTGMAPRTIRFYEQCGVLPAPMRTAAGYRQYGEQDVRQLLFIRRARALGLSLGQLRALTAAVNGRVRGPVRRHVREVVRAHVSAVKRRIRELEGLEGQLEQVLRRMEAPPRERGAGPCRCLDLDESPARPARHAARRR